MTPINRSEDLVHAGKGSLGQLNPLLAVFLSSVFSYVEVISLMDVAVVVAPFLDSLDVCSRNALVVDLKEVLQGDFSSLATIEVLE